MIILSYWRFPGEGNSYPLHYSGLANPMDRGAWRLRSMGSHRVRQKVSFHSNPKERQCQRMLKLPHNCIHPTRKQSKTKILQARLQQFMNCELPDVQAGFRKGRGTKDQIANTRWIIKKARLPEKHLFLLYWLRQSFRLCGSKQTVENSSRNGNTRPPYLPPEKSVCRSRSNS